MELSDSVTMDSISRCICILPCRLLSSTTLLIDCQDNTRVGSTFSACRPRERDDPNLILCREQLRKPSNPHRDSVRLKKEYFESDLEDPLVIKQSDTDGGTRLPAIGAGLVCTLDACRQ